MSSTKVQFAFSRDATVSSEEESKSEQQQESSISGLCKRCHGTFSEKGLILLTSILTEHVECVKVCLEAGADVNTRDRKGRTAVILAVQKGSVQCLDMLLKAGADVNLRDMKKRPTLLFAMSAKSTQCLNLLLKSGADVNIRDTSGRPIIFAAFRRYIPCVDILLQSGADVNAIDNEGNTILHQKSLCLKGAIRVLRQGVKVNVKNIHGLNAITYLLKYSLHKKFALLLLAAGDIVDGSKLLNNPCFLRPSTDISLMHICRKVIRKHLLEMSQMNLFVRVSHLPLPCRMMSYLLYDVTLDKKVPASALKA